MATLRLRAIGNIPGKDGLGLFLSSGPPAAGDGELGQLALDYTNMVQYGPKTEQGWGAGTSYQGAGGGTFSGLARAGPLSRSLTGAGGSHATSARSRTVI